MKKLWITFLGALMFLSLGIAVTLPVMSAFAQVQPTEPTTIEEAARFIPTLIEFALHGKWLAFGAMATLVLVFLVRQYALPKLGLNTKVLPLVSALLGVLVGVGGAVAVGAEPLAALLAVLSGPLASTLYSAIVKYFLPEAPASVK